MGDLIDFKPEKFSSDDDKLESFKMDIINDADVIDDQRDKANEDMRFVNVDGGQWEGFLEDTVDPTRVRLELDSVSNALNRFIGEWNMNRTGVDYKPDESGTTKEDSDLINGIYRKDFRDHSGGIATDNAVTEVSTCGFGAFKLATEFDDDGDPENENQHIVWRPIYNAYNTVYWDQAAQRIDKKDARRCTVLAQFTRKSFEQAYPDKDPVSAYAPSNRAYLNADVRSTDIVYVATRYDVVKKRQNIFVFNNLQTEKVETYTEDDYKLIKDELAADEMREFVRKRKVTTQIVQKTIFSGAEILEPTRRIAGKYIPIISMYGFRAYVDGTERYRGIVRKLKDAQRLFNMQTSQLAENAASAGQEVPIFLREQVQSADIAAIWADKNNKPYLVIDPATDDDGKIISSGPIGYSKPQALDQSTTTLLQIVPNFMKDISGFDPGEAIDKEMSGKAIRALMKRENMNTQVISENIGNAIEWSGEVYQAMAAEIYTRNRIVKTIGKDGSDGSATLLELVMDEDTGTLVESNDLRGKKFKAYSDIGPQYESMREETVENLKGLLELLPTIPGSERYTPIILAVLMNNIEGVGLQELKDFNRNIMLELGLTKPETPEEEKAIEAMKQRAQQPDPQQKLIAAAAQQQEAEARSLDASSLQKTADAKKKAAETTEIIENLDNEKSKLFLQSQKQNAEQAQRGFDNARQLMTDRVN